MDEPDDSNRRWSEMLGRWAIPESLVAAAPASPYFFDSQVFMVAADEAVARAEDTVSDQVARAALPAGGTVLDVGVGAGAASLRLGAGQVIGVDLSPVLLAAFAERAAGLGIEHRILEGTWPQVAKQAPLADVVVCHHVVYNVADLAAFAAALSGHSTSQVVVELTAVHPMSWLTPYWKALHGLSQPDGPTAEDAAAVLTGMGFRVRQRRWRRRVQMIGESGDEQTARVARRLCLPESRHDDLRRLLARTPPPAERDVVTLSWSPNK